VGRNSEHELFRNDPFLEAEHVEFLPDEHGTTVRDLSDENGIFRRIDERTRISHGTRIRLGDQLLLFERILEAYRVLVPIANARTEARLVGSPDPGYWCRLVLSLGGGRRAHAKAFTDSPVIIGRDDGDMTFPDNDFISGRHARIELVDGDVWLQDLDSTNGTYLEVDGDYTLRDRDRLMFGSQIVEFQAD
ncbi:MAG: FHA domain-containing protein, partial [Bradymonadaceae bacterium]